MWQHYIHIVGFWYDNAFELHLSRENSLNKTENSIGLVDQS
jgi:hypothetical protein